MFADWSIYYRQKYVLAFLNRYVSNIPESFWYLVDRNTNITESAHANINHDGKNLNLLTVILR